MGPGQFSIVDFRFGQRSSIVNPKSLTLAPHASAGVCGPEGIRTPGLLSAIEARSQLRYRPKFKVQSILPDAYGHVKAGFTVLVKESKIPI